MQTLYLDLFSGISGDMFIGALVDLGVSPAALEQELAKLQLDGYHLHSKRGQNGSIAGTKFDVHLSDDPHHHHAHNDETAGRHAARSDKHEHDHDHDHEHGHHHHGHAETSHHTHEHQRTFLEIKALIESSPLSPWVKRKAVAVFERIAIAEGKIHGLPADKVHFHEVGAVDSIVDIVGACIGLESLGKPRVIASRVTDGNGWVDCAHGRFPIPAPATLEILAARGVSVTQCNEPHELVTPTGAALLAEFAESFAPMEGLIPEKIGFGLGTRENKSRPNVLRAILGHLEATASTHDWETDTVEVLESNLDDVSSEILGYFVERAFAEGALDVFHTPIQMKKNRPGVLLTVLCARADGDKFCQLILKETTSFGVRRHSVNRCKLHRALREVQTPYGPVSIKIGRLDGKVVQTAPEFEHCKKIAAAARVPLKAVYEAAVKALKVND